MFDDLPGAFFRAAKPGDADAIRDLTRAVYAKYAQLMGREPLTMQVDQAAAIRDHQVWVLAQDGFLLASVELIPEQDCLAVENVAVAEAMQGQGVGRRLMAFAEQEARRQGHGELPLHTNETMVENIGLYASIGYAVIERVPHRGADIVHMRKVLDR